jgi:hypothetical protein
MSATGTWLSIMLAAVLLMGGCDSESSPPPATSHVAQVEPEQEWAKDAFGLLGELAAVIDRLPETVPRSWEEIIESGSVEWLGPETRANRKKGQRLLWKLWLTTGLVPLRWDMHDEETARSWFERNQAHYVQYVAANKARPAREIVVRGLDSAVLAARSQLWVGAFHYLAAKTSLPLDRVVMGSSGADAIVMWRWPAGESGREREQRMAERFSTALRVWLDAKVDDLVWDERSHTFIGELVGCPVTDDLLAELWEAIVEGTDSGNAPIEQ